MRYRPSRSPNSSRRIAGLPSATACSPSSVPGPAQARAWISTTTSPNSSRKLAADARALECEAEVRHALTIVREGAGADRQVDLYRLRRLEGDSQEEALRCVVDQVLAETREVVADPSD